MKLFSMLAEAAAAPQDNTGSIIMLCVMGALLVGMFIFSRISKKKSAQKAEEAINQLKVGDKIVTQAGIFGTIKGIEETTFGKVFLLETGEGKNVGYLSVAATSIWGMDTKEPVVLDANGNPIDNDIEKAKEEVMKNISTEDKKEEKVENVEEKTEEQPAEKPKKTRKTKTK